MKYLKIILVLLIIVFKGYLFNIINNINNCIFDNNNIESTRYNILKNKYDILKNEYDSITSIPSFSSYKDTITKMIYRANYNENEFYIYGDNYKKGDYLINDDGMVGIIEKTYNNYSKCNMLKGLSKINIKIGNNYGTINDYEDNLFIINDFSNYDKVDLNDKVYTSDLDKLNASILIGYVYKIEKKDISKKIYVKSNVDFNNLSYLFVIGEK